MLDGVRVQAINADLTGAFDLTAARRLRENIGLSFIGGMKKGTFDISDEAAQRMLRAPLNPNGRQNSDVIRPWINGLDITRRPRNMWIIDFGVDASEADAALYEYPYEHVRRYVKPEREKVNNPLERKRWWLHGRSAPDLRDAVSGLRRYIATARVAKHRLFVFVPASTLPDGQIVVIAREDDYFFGVLHSKVHEVWALRMGTSLEDRPRYTPTTTFETFPFPWPPGHESPDDPRVIAIASAARELVEKRDRWLNPPEADESVLKKRTLTNLYNERPTWLDLAHRKLDQAVLDAYGWPRDITDDEILSRLLALNLNRAVTTRDGQEDEVTHTEA
jgi:type II restriction/modification system DNA methylase subunit YeeA